jgi:hypothetical protein
MTIGFLKVTEGEGEAKEDILFTHSLPTLTLTRPLPLHNILQRHFLSNNNVALWNITTFCPCDYLSATICSASIYPVTS